MPTLNDPEFLTLVFVGAAGLAVGYYLVYQVLVRLRIRALGLIQGIQKVGLSSGSNCEVEFTPHKGSGGWTLAIRVQSMQSRNYRIPLPITENGGLSKLDSETVEFGRQAFEIGMDWIRQSDKVLEIGSRNFRPLKHGHTGFVDRLGRGLEKVDWKLSCAEGESALEEFANTRVFGPRSFALVASVGALLLSWAEPSLNRGALVLDPLPAYWAALALSVFVFIARAMTFRKRYRNMKRRPSTLGECFWPAFAAGILALIPVRHLNVKFDSSVPRVVSAQVTAKRAVEGFANLSYVVRVKKADGEQSWSVEMSREDYLAVAPGTTIVKLRFHSGALGMEWLERAALDDLDRGLAGTSSGE